MEISVDEAFVDILDHGFHAGIRLGERIAPDMIAVPISPPLAVAVLASEAYFDACGRPETPEDLLQHECIRYRFQSSGRIAPWSFVGRQGEYVVEERGGLIVDTLPTLFSQVRAGLGLGYSFVAAATAEPSPWRVIALLTEHVKPEASAFLYYPREYRRFELLRLFIEHMRWPGHTDP